MFRGMRGRILYIYWLVVTSSNTCTYFHGTGWYKKQGFFLWFRVKWGLMKARKIFFLSNLELIFHFFIWKEGRMVHIWLVVTRVLKDMCLLDRIFLKAVYSTRICDFSTKPRLVLWRDCFIIKRQSLILIL